MGRLTSDVSSPLPRLRLRGGSKRAPRPPSTRRHMTHEHASDASRRVARTPASQCDDGVPKRESLQISRVPCCESRHGTSLLSHSTNTSMRMGPHMQRMYHRTCDVWLTAGLVGGWRRGCARAR
eukprot:3923086-Prymnesium_polylepis.1